VLSGKLLSWGHMSGRYVRGADRRPTFRYGLGFRVTVTIYIVRVRGIDVCDGSFRGGGGTCSGVADVLRGEAWHLHESAGSRIANTRVMTTAI